MTTNRHWTRREFNRTGLAVGTGAILGTHAIASRIPSEQIRSRSTLKVGVIGCGGRGTGAVIQSLFADSDAVLWAMGDLYPEKIEPCLKYASESIAEDADDPATAIEYKIRVDANRKYSGFDCAQRVIDSGVDVVLLTTPPSFRPEQLRAAVNAGKHVFCEKPVAVDAAGVRSVLESARIAKERQLSLMSGFCWRYQDQVKECIERIHSGGIGQIRAIQTTYNTTGWVEPKSRKDNWSDAEFMTRNWQYFAPLSGDHLVEQAVHAIDWQGWVMGDAPPERCWAVGGRQVRPELAETGNVFDHFSITYEYAGGVRAYHMCRHWPGTPSDNSAMFMGSEGVCTMQPWQQSHTIEGTNPWRGTALANDMYQREHDVLFRAIRDDQPVNDGVRMSHSTLLAIMARHAAYTGKVVTWEQALNAAPEFNSAPWTFGKRAIPAVAIPGKRASS